MRVKNKILSRAPYITSDKLYYHNQTFGLVPILAIAEVIPLRG
jgi:hypothetical protein